MANTVDEIKAHLTANNIEYTDSMKKEELIALIK